VDTRSSDEQRELRSATAALVADLGPRTVEDLDGATRRARLAKAAEAAGLMIVARELGRVAAFREMTLQYAGSEGALDVPHAFAANGEVSDQPPMFILNSESDFLRASGEAYAEDLRLAGVDVTVETEPGTRHAHVNGPDEPGAVRSIDRLTTWLRDHGRRGDR
jgi:acetyl esterase/lipase